MLVSLGSFLSADVTCTLDSGRQTGGEQGQGLLVLGGRHGRPDVLGRHSHLNWPLPAPGTPNETLAYPGIWESYL